MNNRVGAAIVPASSRRGIAVSEFPPRYCGERAFASGREWGPIFMGRESRMRWPSLNVEGNFRNVIVLFAFSFSQTITETPDANSSSLCRRCRNGGFRPSFRAGKR
jgi:hypothetical protein